MRRTRHQRKAFGRLFQKLGGLTDIVSAADAPAFFRSWLAGLLLKKNPGKPQMQVLPLKHVRLRQLAEAGFNCPDFRYWLRGELNIPELKSFWEKHGRLSLRNVREEVLLEQTPKLPVAYDKEDWGFIADFCEHHNRQYHTLVNEALPLRDSLVAGNIILLDAERYVVSYFEGYGTPRDVDEKPSSELRVYLRPFDARVPEWAPHGLEELVARLQASHPSFSPVIPKTFEFSIYPYPVGLLRRPEVFWEWRSGSSHDLYTIITKMLERADSHELIFRLPSPGEIDESHQYVRSVG